MATAPIKPPSQVVIDRARKLRLSGSIEQITPDETWLVRSDSGRTYTVLVWIGEPSGIGKRSVNVRCTCDAGVARVPCHHALAILAER